MGKVKVEVDDDKGDVGMVEEEDAGEVLIFAQTCVLFGSDTKLELTVSILQYGFPRSIWCGCFLLIVEEVIEYKG